MTMVVNLGLLTASETQIRLVNQRRGLQRVVRALAAQLLARHTAQLFIDQR